MFCRCADGDFDLHTNQNSNCSDPSFAAALRQLCRRTEALNNYSKFFNTSNSERKFSAMSCTTILVGKNASNDGSTMIARTDDGHFDVKKLIVVEPQKQPRKYKSVLSHVEIDLPDNPMSYTSCPSVDPKDGTWAATGINAANVGMTATETITSNPRVLAADPLVEYKKAKPGKEKEVPGGIGEEDIVVLVLPYIHSAREGVLRLAELLEKYGTYESNGIAFNDENEVWWLETIGGHHWIAKKVPDDVCAINPNQFGMDSFDLEDAFGEKKNHLCSADLRSFIADNHLDTNQNGKFNPRDIFGSHTDMDHIYNTPRAWFMGRYITPYSHKWEGPDAEFTPESDNIPWSFVPDRKLAVEDVAYMLSAHYQGTPFNPYTSHDTGVRGMYRSIGINRTGVTTICQIRPDVPEEIKGLEWICFGSTTFGAFLPVYTNVSTMPKYLSAVTLDTSTENFYWGSRLIGALADPCYSSCIQNIERYQNAIAVKGRQLVAQYDSKIRESLGAKSAKDTEAAQDAKAAQNLQTAQDAETAQNLQTAQDAETAQNLQTTQDAKAAQNLQTVQDAETAQNLQTAQGARTAQDLQGGTKGTNALLEEANKKLCEMAKEQTISTLNKILMTASEHMKNGYNRADN